MSSEFKDRPVQLEITQSTIEIPRDKKGRIRWKILAENPEILQGFIRAEVLQLYQEEHKFSNRLFSEKGLNGISTAISTYYPGGRSQLRADLGISLPPRQRSWDIQRIETETLEFYQKGSRLTKRNLKEVNRSLASAIDRLYPGRLSKLRANLGLVPEHKPKGYYTTEQIEKDAGEFFEKHGRLTSELLAKNGNSSLSVKISSEYPGGIAGLKARLGIENHFKPAGYWTTERIKEEALIFYKQHSQISNNLLFKAKQSGLGAAITRLYPGGWSQLKVDLNLPTRQQAGFWTKEEIEQQALEFYRQEKGLTTKLLQDCSRYNLLSAIISKYPGGIPALRDKLAIGNDIKSKGYWTLEKIKEEAREFYNQFEELTQKELKKQERQDLMAAIGKVYPGKMMQLKMDLGLNLHRRLNGSWSSDLIEQEAQKFYQKNGVLSNNALTKLGGSNLAHAIHRYYPGGIMSLIGKLGIEYTQKPQGYWTPETIKEEAKRFYEEFGRLGTNILRKYGRPGLAAVINKRYPGKLPQLKIDLGIVDPNAKTQSISPEEANEQLRKLLAEN